MKARILMVDDEPRNLLALEAVLESLDQELVRANSGQEALARLLKEEFAVILMDVQMPGMDGFEAASMIRSREKTRYIPIIFMTAVGKTEAEMFHGYEVGAVDYLLKPFSPEILRYKVRILIDLQSKAAEIRRLNVELKEANSGLERRVRERTLDLEERSAELGRSNQELAQYAAVASHDLQEPLRTLSTYLQLLGDNNMERFSAQDKEFMGIALGSARRMRRLINDLLAFSQVGSGKAQLSDVDCGELVKKTLQLLKDLVLEKGAQVRVGALPTLHAEPVLLGQVFQNLIGNALKFGAAGTPICVDVDAAPGDGCWVFKVKDNGIGIDPKHFGKIFKLFQRLHSSEDYPGTGLGLSICKKAVEKLGGKIWLESAPGEGAAFYFSVPPKPAELSQ